MLTVTFEPAAVPPCAIFVTVSVAAVLVRLTAPLVALVALKLDTALLLPSVVPPFEFVVSNAPPIVPAPASLITPVAAVCAEFSVTLPPVVTLPAFSTMSRPAFTVIAPDVLLAVAFTSTSAVAPVAVRPTVPEPPAVTVLPTVRVPAFAVRLMAPLLPVEIVPVLLSDVELLTVILPPLLLLAVTVKPPAAVFVTCTIPLVVLENPRFDTAVSSALAAPMPAAELRFRVPAETSVATAAWPWIEPVPADAESAVKVAVPVVDTPVTPAPCAKIICRSADRLIAPPPAVDTVLLIVRSLPAPVTATMTPPPVALLVTVLPPPRFRDWPLVILMLNGVTFAAFDAASVPVFVESWLV